MQSLRVGIVGAGRMGRIRAISAQANDSCRVTLIADSISERASSLASEVGAQWSTDWKDVLNTSDVDVVVVATTHRHLATVSAAALAAGKHVFCEKPMARDVMEGTDIVKALSHPTSDSLLSPSPRMIVGYTLRHHPAIQMAWKVVRSGELGSVLYLRGRYGHGGRPGYGDEWRTSPDESGGGQLLDQGVHLIDLSRCFLGNFTKTIGTAKCFHWAKGRTEVEDNVFMVLETSEERVAFLHASWTQWRNLFSLEVFLEGGAVIVDGLGGSYGPEILRIIKRQPSGGIPEIRERKFPSRQLNGLDEVWALEWQAFLRALSCGEGEDDGGDLAPAGPSDGLAVLATVHALYESVRSELAYRSAS